MDILIIIIQYFGHEKLFVWMLLVLHGASQLEVSNQNNFVILNVDGSKGLVVGMGGPSKQTEEVQTGELRLALGGILIDKEKMMIQV